MATNSARRSIGDAGFPSPSPAAAPVAQSRSLSGSFRKTARFGSCPCRAPKTQWFRKLQKNRAISVQAGSRRKDLQARLLKSAGALNTVVQHFREKYTPGEIKRWYSGLGVAVENSVIAFEALGEV